MSKMGPDIVLRSHRYLAQSPKISQTKIRAKHTRPQSLSFAREK